jgi:DNA replication protein DnaC
MERVGEAISRLRPRAPVWDGIEPSEPEPQPACSICKDHGFVRHDVAIDHADFGRAIPCSCRQGEVRDRLRRRSNLGHLALKTFETFKPGGRDGPLTHLADALEACRTFAESPKDDLPWLVLSGPSGCGKTHLAAAIANRQIELGNEVFFAIVPDLLDHLRATFGPGSDVTYDELFEAVRNSPLLVLDDLGAQSETSWAQEKMFQVLNHRFNAELPTVITTNYAIHELDQRLRARLSDKQAARVIQIGERDTSLDELLRSDWTEGLRMQTFATFERKLPSLAKAADEASTFAQQPRGWLVLVGDVGRGKTHLAAAIKNHLEDIAVFITVPRLLDHLRATYAPTSQVTYDRAFDRFLNAPVLILDDYGTQSSKPWAEEKLFQLLNHRFNARLATVITTNIPFDQPRRLSPASQQQERVYSRILDDDLVRIVGIEAPHFRRPGLELKRRRA